MACWEAPPRLDETHGHPGSPCGSGFNAETASSRTTHAALGIPPAYVLGTFQSAYGPAICSVWCTGTTYICHFSSCPEDALSRGHGSHVLGQRVRYKLNYTRLSWWAHPPLEFRVFLFYLGAWVVLRSRYTAGVDLRPTPCPASIHTRCDRHMLMS